MDTKPSVKPVKFLVSVDKADESRIAMRFACAKARKRGGSVDILHVIEPPADLQGFAGLADKARKEKREAAETLLNELAAEVNESFGLTPSFVIREGEITDEIVAACEEDPDVTMLVLGAAPESNRYSKILSQLSNQSGKRLLIPIMIVPGNLTDQQIEEVS